MNARTMKDNQSGFSLLELMVSLGVMLIITASIMGMLRNSLKLSSTTYEMTDVQQSLRTAHEYLNRDLVMAGDGLRGISKIRVPSSFVTNYLTLAPITDSSDPGYINLPILASDNDVPANTTVLLTSPSVTVRSNPTTTDRITMMGTDPTFNSVPLLATDIVLSSSNASLNVSAADVSRFSVGEIYFLTTELGGAFGTITSITAANGNIPPKLNFATGDTYGLNLMGTNGPIRVVTAVATKPASLSRMQIIHYFINSNGLLIRRVFGVKGAGFADSVVAEHVTNLQFRYVLNLLDANGFVRQPVQRLADSDQQDKVRQVEVTCTAETVHFVGTQNTNGTQTATRQQISMTTSTSVRNLQFFREALQPRADDPSLQ